MKNILNKIIYKFYSLVFGEKPSLVVENFIRNLWYIAIGFGFCAIFSFAFQIITGKFLGPIEYGKFILVQSIAAFLYIPMSFCINIATIKYNSEREDITRQRKIISAAYFLVFVFSVASLILFFVFSNFFSKIFRVPLDIFYFSIIFALSYNLYILATDTLRSLHKMKELSIIQILYGLFILIAICPFILTDKFSFKIALFIEYITYFFVFLIIIIYIHRYLIFDFDKFWIIKLLRYGRYGIIAGMASAFYLNFSKIIINKNLTLSELGMFGAYYVSFMTLPSFLFNIFNIVFFPSVSKTNNKSRVFIKLNKAILFFIFLGMPLIAILGSIFFKLYGAKYSFNLELGLLFTFSSLLVLIDSTYGWLMNSIGEKGVKITSIAAVALAIANMALSIVLIPKFGLYGVAIAIIISYFFSIYIMLLNKKNLFNVIENAGN